MRGAGVMGLVMAVGLLTGCGGGNSAAPGAGPNAPLTVDDWKKLPVEQKYTPEAFERLKKGDSKFENEEAWDAFLKSVVAPARKKDFPGGKPR